MKTLVCPLNWGLGHATRCIPLIKKIMDEGDDVTIVAEGSSLELLKMEFPVWILSVIRPSGYNYSPGKSQVVAMIKALPAIVTGTITEHRWLKRLLKTQPFDRVISDNRFGLFSDKVHSVYITHQLMIKMPAGLRFLEPAVWLLHRCIICRYDECYIPDAASGNGWSGDLGHKYPVPENAIFIGILSRFQSINKPLPDTTYQRIVLISGVEPHRSIFEKEMLEKYCGDPSRTLLLRGLPDSVNTSGKTTVYGNVDIIPHLNSEKLATLLTGCTEIVCRSGYSTVMDLVALDCIRKAVFVPTPGQTEQEYLARYLNKKNKTLQ